MPISPYLRDLRRAVGTRRLLLPGVAAVIRDARGHILVMQHAGSGRWSLPAGGVEPGESPEAAVVREVAEEAYGCWTRSSPQRLAERGSGCATRTATRRSTPSASSRAGSRPALRWPSMERRRRSTGEDVPGRLHLPYPADLFTG